MGCSWCDRQKWQGKGGGGRSCFHPTSRHHAPPCHRHTTGTARTPRRHIALFPCQLMLRMVALCTLNLETASSNTSALTIFSKTLQGSIASLAQEA